MKKKPSALKDILFLSISSFIVVVAWIGFNIYHSYITSTITQDLQVQISPIHPEFDTITLEKLKARKQVPPVTQLTTKVKAEPTAAVAVPAARQDSLPSPLTPEPSQTQTPTLENDIPVTIDGE